VAEALVEPFHGAVTKVAGVESRGFILGTSAALALGVGFVPVRKAAGLFPGPKRPLRASRTTAASGTRWEFSGQR
jgi:adenine phosphoribosyltransferase